MVILSGFLGVGLGIMIGFIREYANNSGKENKEKIIYAKSLAIKNISDLFPLKILKMINKSHHK